MISFGGLNQALFWLKTAADYLIAGGLVALGVYVALYWQHRFARIVGIMLVGGGIGWGCFAYGKTIGGAACYAQWRAANEQAKLDAQKRDAEIAQSARDFVEQQNKEIVFQNENLMEKVKEYEAATAKIAAKCRIATPDDVKRLCDIGSASPECKSTKRLRPAG